MSSSSFDLSILQLERKKLRLPCKVGIRDNVWGITAINNFSLFIRPTSLQSSLIKLLFRVERMMRVKEKEKSRIKSTCKQKGSIFTARFPLQMRFCILVTCTVRDKLQYFRLACYALNLQCKTTHF